MSETAGGTFDDAFKDFAATGQPTTGPAMPAPSARVVDVKNGMPGLGIEVVGRPPTRFYDPNGSATFNPDFNPFNARGELAVERDSVEYAGRYLGGDRSLHRARFQLAGGAENEFMVGARVLIAAFNSGYPSFEDLPFRWLPGVWTGQASMHDLLDFCFIASMPSGFVQRWYAATEDPQGKTPEFPYPMASDLRHEGGRRADGTYYRFFIAPHPTTGRPQYWRHDTPSGGPTSEVWGYERDYPPVFGVEPKPGGAPQPSPPPPTPAPPPVPTPRPEPPRPSEPTPAPLKVRLSAETWSSLEEATKWIPVWRLRQRERYGNALAELKRKISK